MNEKILFAEHEEPVRSEWIDGNGHMNVGYYLLPFENATSAFCRHLDISKAYRERTNHAVFAAETHLTFEREVKEGDRLRFETRLLDWSVKWINLIHFMYNADQGYLAATNQLLFVHVSLETRRAVPMTPAHQEQLAVLLAEHGRMLPSPQAGRAIGPGRPAPD